MLTKRNLETLRLWGETLSYCENHKWTKWDQNLMLKLINEIKDYNHKNYLKQKKS